MPYLDPLRVSYAVERYRYLAYGSPLCFPAADVNLDTRVNIDDLFDFMTFETNGDPRADINNNGRFDPEPPPPGENEIPTPTWGGSDTQIFASEYTRTVQENPVWDFVGDGELAALVRGEPDRQLRAIGILSQPQVEGQALGVHNRFGYRGYWFEPELGTYFVRNRVYDPRFGRWLTRDPIGYAGGQNLYRYVQGRPFRFFDPFGLDLLDWMVNVAAGFGDAVTFGVTDSVRESMGYNDVVDKGTGAYLGGFGTGALTVGIVTGGAGAQATIAVTGAKGVGAAIGGGAIAGIFGDAAIQGTMIQGGYQTSFDPTQNAIAGIIGGGLGAVLHGLNIIIAGSAEDLAGAAAGAASQVRTGSAQTGTALSTIRFTSPGEVFIRYESAARQYSRVTSLGGVQPGTFAAPASDGIVPVALRSSVYNLPSPEISRSVVHILRPPPGTPVIGPRPVSGGSGCEVVFPAGF